MLPEVEKYFTDVRNAKSTYNKTQKKLTETVYREDRNAYYTKIDEAAETQKNSIDDAWNSLKESDDPIVRFIAKKCGSYPEYAVQVLRMLPCSVDTIKAYATDEGWCNTWHDFLEEAVDAGLVPGVEPMAPERRAIVKYVRSTYNSSVNTLDKLMELVDAYAGAMLESSDR